MTAATGAGYNETMAAPILATKLFIPPTRPNTIPRPRLIEKLNACLHHRLTLISAPAGFGKTTLVSEWLAGISHAENQDTEQRIRAAWVSLDEGDNVPTRFLTYLIAAIQTIATEHGAEALEMLHSPQPPPVEPVLTALLNDIIMIPDPFVLVLDDYHVVVAQPVDVSKSIDEVLSYLLKHLPPQMHLVITTREDPQLPLSRLRARGQLTELRAADLRFTEEEAAAFLNQGMRLELSADDVATLETRTEGWIAGLQLAALSMQGRVDVAGFIQAFSGDHRYIMDFLVEEVLQRQSQLVRGFLLQTAILDRLCGQLCDAVTGLENGSALLETLERDNLFVVPLDDQRRWFRYHHLFADVLQAHLMEEQPDSVPILHQRASAWYEDNGLWREAMRHAFQAADLERAARLAELAWPAMDSSFQTATWLRWVKELPDDLVRARPVLSTAYGWALLETGQLESAETQLNNAERWLDAAVGQPERVEEAPSAMVVADEAQFRALPVSIATARAYLAQAAGDVPATIHHGRRALDLLPATDLLQRGIVAALLAMAYWANGDLETAHRTLADGMADMQAAGNILYAIRGTYSLADICLAQGRLREAIRTYEQSLQLAAEHGEQVLRGTADLYLQLSELYYEQNDLQAAAQSLERSETLGEQAASPHWQYRYRLALARIKQAQGDLDGALELLDEAERLYVRTPVPDITPISALKARTWVEQGRLMEAQAWVQDRRLSVNDELSYLREFEHITLARVRIAQYKHHREQQSIGEAVRLLERLLDEAETGGRTGSVIEILNLQALAYEAQVDIPSALVPFDRALLLAEPEGYIQRFVDEGQPMSHLLNEALSRGRLQRHEQGYVRKLLAVFASRRQGKEKSAGLSDQSLIEPLSERELEILRLVALGLTNRQISERLFLAIPTVKGHNRNIYGKLQATSRTEAVARARELGLL